MHIEGMKAFHYTIYLSLQAGVTNLRCLISTWLLYVSFVFGTMTCACAYACTRTAGWSALLTGLLQSICTSSLTRCYPTGASVELLSLP